MTGIGSVRSVPDEPTVDDVLDVIDERDRAEARASGAERLVLVLLWVLAGTDHQRQELLARPTTDAYEASCVALERRRVALVDALGADSGLSFYDAVTTVRGLVAGKTPVNAGL